jgi:hypothetical protein
MGLRIVPINGFKAIIKALLFSTSLPQNDAVLLVIFSREDLQ